jgi:hypothetical protein
MERPRPRRDLNSLQSRRAHAASGTVRQFLQVETSATVFLNLHGVGAWVLLGGWPFLAARPISRRLRRRSRPLHADALLPCVIRALQAVRSE